MITHYDMLTGEVIEAGSQEARPNHPTPTQPETQLRLLSVAEAQLLERQAPAAGVLMLPIDQLVGG